MGLEECWIEVTERAPGVRLVADSIASAGWLDSLYLPE